MKKGHYAILCLALILFLANYNSLDKSLGNFLDNSEFAHVDRIIDGDTVVTSEGEHIRLLGMNTPEKGEQYHDEAEKNLADLIENKTVSLEFGKDRTDLYNRTLAYIFLNGENINQKQIEKGLANFYFPKGKDAYYDSFKNSWNQCINENKNLCEKSRDKCSECIELKSLDYKTQQTVFYNKCGFSCDLTGWKIKDEGRKNFAFPKFALEGEKEVAVKVGNGTNSDEILFWNNMFQGKIEYVWTKTGDTLFLRDENGRLILWKNY